MNEERSKRDAEMLPGVTYTLEDFMSEEDFIDFISGDIGIDVEGVAKGFLQNDTVDHLTREGWHKSAISAVQAMARHWLDTAAASRWVSIAENGLPSEAGKYAWWAHDESDHHHWNGLWYDPATFDEQDREAMSRTYTHYQKIEPPKENT